MADTVADISPEAALLHRHLEMFAALFGGTVTMREGGSKFLPAWPGEDTEDHRLRIAAATLLPAYRRTVTVLASRPFSKPLKFSEDMPKIISGIWALDIDRQGNSLHEFGANLLEEVLGNGFAGVLVDAPTGASTTERLSGTASRAEQQRAGVRPYFVIVRAQSILGWRAEILQGESRLTQLRLLETVTEADGQWGERKIEQVRVLYPGKWETWRFTLEGGRKVWALHESGTTALDQIPFVPVYGIYRGFMRSAPPLLDLAYLNIEHWQSKSDQQTILHVARVPILTAKGVDDKFKLKIGASSAVVLPADGALAFTEHSGKSIEAGAKSLLELQEEMRQTGGELLVIRPGEVLATQIWSENEAGMSTLQRITINLELSLNRALDLLAQFGGETTAGKVTLWKDFGVTGTPKEAGDWLLRAQTQGLISRRTTFTESQRRGLLDANIRFEEEQARVEEDGGSLGTIGEEQTD